MSDVANVQVVVQSPNEVTISEITNTVEVVEDGETNVYVTLPGTQGIQGPVGPQGPIGPTPVISITYSLPGILYTSVGATRLYFYGPCTVQRVIASVGTPPSGASIIVDVNKNGSSLFGIQTNRPTIASGLYVASNTPSITNIASGDYLTIDVDQIGSVTKGSDLVVTIEYTRTE